MAAFSYENEAAPDAVRATASTFSRLQLNKHRKCSVSLDLDQRSNMRRCPLLGESGHSPQWISHTFKNSHKICEGGCVQHAGREFLAPTPGRWPNNVK